MPPSPHCPLDPFGLFRLFRFPREYPEQLLQQRPNLLVVVGVVTAQGTPQAYQLGLHPALPLGHGTAVGKDAQLQAKAQSRQAQTQHPTHNQFRRTTLHLQQAVHALGQQHHQSTKSNKCGQHCHYTTHNLKILSC